MGEYSSSELNYCILGDHSRPVITFLHGFLGSHRDWLPIATALRDQFCCVLIDLPGHGDSLLRLDRQYSMEATAALVIAILQQQQIQQSGLYGYSMGGRLGLYLTMHHPQRFPNVILESASPGLRSQTEKIARQHRDNELADRLEQNFPQFLQDWYAQPLFTSLQQHPQFEPLLKQRSHNAPLFLAKSLRHMGLGMQPNLWPDLAKSQTIMRLLVGELDRKFIAIQTEIAGLCQTATIKTVENTGHNIHFENPQAIIREISGFYSNH